MCKIYLEYSTSRFMSVRVGTSVDYGVEIDYGGAARGTEECYTRSLAIGLDTLSW